MYIFIFHFLSIFILTFTYCYCEKRVFVKGSTILKMYAKIEETQREYNRLDNRLIELENAQ